MSEDDKTGKTVSRRSIIRYAILLGLACSAYFLPPGIVELLTSITSDVSMVINRLD